MYFIVCRDSRLGSDEIHEISLSDSIDKELSKPNQVKIFQTNESIAYATTHRKAAT